MAAADAARDNARGLLANAEATRSKSAGDALLKADQRAIQAEHEALAELETAVKDPVKAKALGLEIDPEAAKDIGTQSEANKQAAAEEKVARHMLQLEQKGPAD